MIFQCFCRSPYFDIIRRFETEAEDEFDADEKAREEFTRKIGEDEFLEVETKEISL
jgi:hypothetical protein